MSSRTPPVPPSTQTYEPLARSVLRRRLLYDILTFSALPVWASTVFWNTWYAGGISTLSFSNAIAMPFIPTTLLMTILVWAFGVLPIIVLRKLHLTAVPMPSSSPSQRVQVAFSKPSTLRALLVYTLSSTLVSTLHILLGYLSESVSHRGDYLGVFVKSRRHPYYLNGRFVFFFMAQISLAIGFHFRSILLDRSVVRWTQGQVLKSVTMLSLFRHALGFGITTLAFTTATFAVYILAFGLMRAIALPLLFHVPLVSHLFRPFLSHFLRGRWALVHLFRNRGLVWHTFLLGLTTIGEWEFAESLFDNKVQEPLAVAPHTADPLLTVISGITSSDPYYLHFSYIELCRLAEDDSATAGARRTIMFGDQKHSPTLWATLVRNALLTLGKDYQVLLRRGAPPSAPAVPAPKPKPEGLAAPATPLIRKPIFKPTQSSPLGSVVESLAADGAVTQALTHTLDSTVAQLPDLFKSTEPPAPMVAVQKTVASVKAAKPPLLWKVAQWWLRPRASRLADCAVPNRETDSLIAEVLSRLVCASLTEDRYGTVQRDIPRILEALLTFLDALEDAQREVAVSDDAEEASRAIDIYCRPADAMKEAIVRIVQTFGSRLTAFRFPPRVAQKLQGFADYY
ncbi:nucleoporin protein Ndc1-Nup [Multifurca ochricompacta]|uniref:Nucleoporin protein Ndc1-Nup n=1 Tax=Multifurca ochricompacta TaxID=376703 RepID=A0AAD4M4P4_9AGAM|nr:nucleoporin protein Ndc1-Nup [Multifurca ochricompacta]